MSRVVDPEQAQLTAVLGAADFSGKRILEVGCGEGRLTWGIASQGAAVLAFDPFAAAVEIARATCPDELREKVRFEVASAAEIEVEPQSVEIGRAHV